MERLHYQGEDPDDDVLRKLREERDAVAAEIRERQARVVGTGVSQHASSEQMLKLRERYTREYNWAVKAQRHLWVATTAFVLSDHAVQNMASESINLDLENMLTDPAIGCFICEQEYEPRMRLRKCPGEPPGAAVGD